MRAKALKIKGLNINKRTAKPKDSAFNSRTNHSRDVISNLTQPNRTSNIYKINDSYEKNNFRNFNNRNFIIV